jgi:hypothetical protein
MRFIRVIATALAILALTAPLVFAGRDDAPPPAAEPGLDTARAASGQDVPVRANEDQGELGEEETIEAQVEPEVELEVAPEIEPEVELDVEPAVEGGEHCIAPGDEAVEPVVDGEEPNHGAIVCGAARFGDWEAAGCDNHGQYVRTFANKNLDGEPGECEQTEATETQATETEPTVEAVQAGGTTTAAGNGNGHGTGHGNGNGNGNGHGRGHGRP